jgi:mRNA-degrading endonuclease RelE of RelBE toxin-antitoxin system
VHGLPLVNASGYIMARMRFEIVLAPEAVADFKRLRAHDRGTVKDALEVHLRHDPTKASRSRIKRLRGVSKPQYRLRVGDVRVFYDVGGGQVSILAIVPKRMAASCLERQGKKT